MTHDSPLNRAIWISLAQAAYEKPDHIAARLQEQKHVIGHWRIAWQAESGDGGNLVYVAHSLDEDTWAVVTRGSLTHPLEKGFWTDWAMEDLQIFKQEPLPFQLGDGNARIAAGMRLAFDHVMNMEADGHSLKSFLLDHLVAGRDQLWFVGHSLGGAVTPILATWFQHVVEEAGAMSTDFITPVSFAGPTPGNRSFAAEVEQRFGGFPLRFVNDLDMVPHTWTPEGLKWIISSYQPSPRIPLWFRTVCRIVRGYLWARRIHYAQPGKGYRLKGQLADTGQWFKEVNEQHEPDTYYRLLGPQTLVDLTD